MKDKTFTTLIGLFFLLFIGGVIAIALEKPTAGFFTRASNANFSPLKSFAIVFPQVVSIGNTATGKSAMKTIVSVYLRDVNGTVIPNRSVHLSVNSNTVIITPSDTISTGANGLAQFSLTSNTAQKVELSITDSTNPSTPIVNVPTVEFTQ